MTACAPQERCTLLGMRTPTIPRCFTFFVALSVVVVLGACQGTQARNLRITEVGKRAVELVFDEPSGSLKLGGSYRLSMTTSTGTNTVIGLSHATPIPAGGYFMVWSEAGYNGPIVAQDFPGGQTGAVQGIKVPSNLFTDLDGAPSEVRLYGTRNRATGLLVIFPLFKKDVIDDVVRFGQPEANRPATGGTFNGTGTLNNPSGSQSLARRWANGRPLDTNSETDWRDMGPTSWGVPTN